MTRIAAVKSIAARRAQNQRGHDIHGRNAVPAPDHGVLSGIVIDLPIPAVHAVCRVAVGVVVARELIRPGQRRQQTRERGRSRGDTVGGNYVSGERRPAGAVGVAGQRIVDRGGSAAEIARSHGRSGQSQVRIGCVLALLGAFIIHEPEQLVLAVNDLGNPDRTADGESVLVLDVLRQAAGMAEVIVDRHRNRRWYCARTPRRGDCWFPI